MSNIDNRKRKVLIFIGLLAVGYIIVLRNFLEYSSWLSNWLRTHWLFSMQRGFYSRALVGSIMQALIPKYCALPYVIYTAGWIITMVLSTILIILGFRYWKLQENYTGLLVAGVLIASPGTIQFFAADSLRFDQIGYIVIITIACLIPLIPRRIHWFLVSAVAVVLVLVHEALLFLVVPVLVAVVLANRIDAGNSRKDAYKLIMCAVASLLPAAVLALVLLTKGRFKYSPEAFLKIKNNLAGIANFTVDDDSLTIQFRSLWDNIIYTQNWVFKPKNALGIFLGFLSLLPSGAVAFIVLVNSLRSGYQIVHGLFAKIIKKAVVLFCFAPLIIAFAAADYQRWIAVVVTNLFVVGMIIEIQRRSRGTIDNADRPLRKISNLSLGLIIALSLSIGPISASDPPHCLVRLLKIFHLY